MNCTEEHALKIIHNYYKSEWHKVKSVKFPYPKIDSKRCLSELKSLMTIQTSTKTSSPIIRKFHKSMHEANRKGRLSSYEYWQKIKSDKELFKKFYYNRLMRSDWFKEKDNYKYLERGEVPIEIYYCGLTTSGFAPLPSYFKPMLAKYLINKYLSKYKTIFDPFSGYSGRMLGAIACKKNYIGQDINKITLEESKYIYQYISNYIKGSVKLIHKDSLKSKGNYECLFTCSPYGNIENWNQKIKSYSCDEWIDKIIARYKCNRYVFVTDNTIKKYKKYVKEKINNTSHWGKNSEYVVVI